MRAIAGDDGWPDAYEYSAGTQKTILRGDIIPGVSRLLHIKLFHPANDHYGLSPLEAAATAVDVHNTASRWNKALLDNAARPSGAIVYRGADGQAHMSADQYDRLVHEMEAHHQGARNACLLYTSPSPRDS